MTTIALEGMQFFANHGYYEEEQANIFVGFFHFYKFKRCCNLTKN